MEPIGQFGWFTNQEFNTISYYFKFYCFKRSLYSSSCLCDHVILAFWIANSD